MPIINNQKRKILKASNVACSERFVHLRLTIYSTVRRTYSQMWRLDSVSGFVAAEADCARNVGTEGGLRGLDVEMSNSIRV